VRSLSVVLDASGFDDAARMRQADEPMFVQAFIAELAVGTFDIRILVRLARSNEGKMDTAGRKVDPSDTRARIVQLTPTGIAKLEEVRVPYYRLLGRIFRNRDGVALDRFVEYLDNIRSRLSTAERRVNDQT
jgi:hypothetical protein